MSTFHVVAYTDKIANAATPEGMRYSVIRWRETKEVKASGKKVPAPVAVLVPEIPVVLEKPEQLKAAIREAVNGMQDNRIRALLAKYVEDDTSVNLLSIRIPAEEVTEAGVAAWLATENTGGRLSGDLVRSWFDATMQATIVDRIMAKKPDIQQKELDQIVAGYRATFMKLASPVTPIAPTVLEKLAELLAEATSEGASKVDEQIAAAIAKRVPKSEDEMLMEI